MALNLELHPLNDADTAPLLVVGPSLGTTAQGLWADATALLDDSFHVIGWDLPGHGDSAVPDEPFTIADLAAAVVRGVDALVGRAIPFVHAGDSIGGAVTQQLMLDVPERVDAGAALCSAAWFNGPDGWLSRAELVRSRGTGAVVDSSRQRWFAPGFVEQNLPVVQSLLQELAQVDAEGYALTCQALAAFDVRERLPAITGRLLVVGGRDDQAVANARQIEIADLTPRAHLLLLDGVAHLAPVEAPRAVAEMLRTHFTQES